MGEDRNGKERGRNRDGEECERTTEMRDGNKDRGRGLMGSRAETRHLPRPVEGPRPSHPQGALNTRVTRTGAGAGA